MGLFSLFRKLRKGNSQARLLILGLDNSGKTTIVKTLSNEDIQTVMPTQGFNVKTLQKDGIRLDVWDIGGQNAIRPWWRNYFDRTDALIYVVDSFDRKRLEEAGNELELLLEDMRLQHVPLLVFANKQDLAGALEPSEIADGLSLFSQRTRAWQIEGCSAKDGIGLDHGMNWIVQQLTSK
eukprot:jgi/Ulvmu1/11583/UM079_0027.1